MLPGRKHLVWRIYKQTESYILKEPLEARTLRLPYDAGAELGRVEHSLKRSLNAEPMFNIRTGTPEEEATRLDDWYDARLAEIAREEQRYRQGIAEAEKSGAIDTSKANGLLVNLSSPFPTNPFERARREASEIYWKRRKF